MEEDDKTIFIEKNLLSTDRNRPKHKRHYEELYTKEYIDELLKNTVGNPVLVGTNLNFTQVDGSIIPIDLSTIGGDGFIQLSGTEVGSPVTGDIEFDNEITLQNKLFSGDAEILFDNDNDFFILSKGAAHVRFDAGAIHLFSNQGTYFSEFFLYEDGLSFQCDAPTSNGISSNLYYGANYDDNTYVQKKYVDDNFVKIGTTAPTSATDTGTVGEIRVTPTYIYTCVATDTWVRAAVATW